MKELDQHEFCPLQTTCPDFFPNLAKHLQEGGKFCDSCRDVIKCEYFYRGFEPHPFDYCGLVAMRVSEKSAKIKVLAKKRGISI